MNNKDRSVMRRAERDYLTPPDPETGACGVCGGVYHENEYQEEVDQFLCNNCDVGDLE